MPAASPEDNLPFLLDEDPSRGSSRHGSQAGSSMHGATAMQLPQQQQPAQHSLQQPQPGAARACSSRGAPGLWTPAACHAGTRDPLNHRIKWREARREAVLSWLQHQCRESSVH